MKNFYFNQVQLKGKLTSPEWSYTDNDGTMFFSSILQVKRSNGITDYIPIYFAEKVIKSIPKGAVFVKIVGIIKGEKTEGKISLFVLANKVELLSDIEYENKVTLVGHIFNKKTIKNLNPSCYLTRFFMTVGNIKVPLMAWKALAQKVNEMSINEPLYIIGRIQNTKQITHYYIDSSEVSYPFRVNALSISATPKEEL